MLGFRVLGLGLPWRTTGLHCNEGMRGQGLFSPSPKPRTLYPKPYSPQTLDLEPSTVRYGEA